MSAENDGSEALVPGRSHELVLRSDALARRGFELIGQIDQQARRHKQQLKAKQHLDEAWIEFATGFDNAFDQGVLGYLIDAFDDGVHAAAEWLMVEFGEEDSTASVFRTLIGEAKVTAGPNTELLVTRMEQLRQEEGGVDGPIYKQIVEHELQDFVSGLFLFLQEVAGLLDPSMVTTSPENAMARWDEIIARPSTDWIKNNALSRKSGRSVIAGNRVYTLPDLGENIKEGTVLHILVKPGDRLKLEQAVLEIETDKAFIELPSSVAGRVKQIMVKVGEKVKIGQPILIVDDDGPQV